MSGSSSAIDRRVEQRQTIIEDSTLPRDVREQAHERKQQLLEDNE